MKVIDQSVKILRPTSQERAIEGLRLVEYVGRNCYRSQDRITDDSYQRFIDMLLERCHDSPLEFEDITVEFVTSRDVMAEITRHRMASFCIQSQRYVMDDKVDGEISFIKPDFYIEIGEGAPAEETGKRKWEASRCWEGSMYGAESYYKVLRHSLKMPTQDARKVLPNSTACVICMKANLREWLHILQLRDSQAAYPEMQTLMKLLRPKLWELYGKLFHKESDENASAGCS